jgi:hypothetical protein
VFDSGPRVCSTEAARVAVISLRRRMTRQASAGRGSINSLPEEVLVKTTFSN